MVFVFSPYIWKLSSYFQFQVILTNNFTAQHMTITKLYAKYCTKLPLLAKTVTTMPCDIYGTTCNASGTGCLRYDRNYV